MKFLKILLFSLFFFNNYNQAVSNSNQDPLLVVICMVKNEALVIEATLQPFIDAGHQHYLILDTGSTDDTVNKVRTLFKKNNISYGYVEQEPFVNFSVTRNVSLERAERLFPQAVFFLVIDAEWYVHNVQGLLEFCEKHKNHESVSFSIYRIHQQSESKKNVDDSGYINWLFKAHHGVKFRGAVHECINQPAFIMAPRDIYIVYNPSKKGLEKTQARWRKDRDALLQEYAQDPSYSRTAFILGQTYACLKDYKQAIFWYLKSCMLQQSKQRNYSAYYRVAGIYQKQNNWPQALFYYYKAHYILPRRVEPLVCIAKHYVDVGDYASAFLVAKVATSISLSNQEVHLQESRFYEFARYRVLATAAWHIGEYETSLWATLKALQYKPCDQQLLGNVVLCEQVLNHYQCNALDRRLWCHWCNGDFWFAKLAQNDISRWCSMFKPCYWSNRCNIINGSAWRMWC